MTKEVWAALGDVMILATGIVGVLFVLMYGLLAPWWRTVTGRNIFSVMLVLAANAMYFGWIVFFVGHVPLGFYPIRALLFTAMFVALSHRLYLGAKVQILIRLRQRAKRKAHIELEDTR